jgi:steroid delta-isomerase-like uncharacterized protein
MTRDAIIAIFERRRAAYAAKDSGTLVQDYSTDCVIESPTAGTHQGRAAAERALRTILDALDVTIHEEDLLIDGDKAAQILRLEGTDSGEFLGLPPTGRTFRVPGVFLYTFDNGLITHERRIYDFTSMLVQIGRLKAKPA